MANGKLKILVKDIALYNDRAAFSRFFKLYHARLIRFALLFVWSYKDAEDVVSEVMIKLLRQRKNFLKIDNFEGYLYRSIKNQALNVVKKNKLHTHLFISDIPDDYLTGNYIQPLELVMEKDLRYFIHSVVENLPPQRKAVYKLIKDDGLKITEVAELLQIAQKTVKKHLELALKDVRKAIESHYLEKKAITPVIKMTKKNFG